MLINILIKLGNTEKSKKKKDIHSFDKYLLKVSYKPGILVGTQDILMNKRDKKVYIYTVDPWTMQRLWCWPPHCTWRGMYKFWRPQNLTTLSIHRRLVPGLPWTPKSVDAQILYIKWHRLIMHTVGPSVSVDSQLRTETEQVFTENSPYINGPAQLKPVLFKGQLYSRMV